jgi:hypothetical protein
MGAPAPAVLAPSHAARGGRPSRAPAPVQASPAARAPGREALRIIVETPRLRANGRRDGGRHLSVGRSGCGKSYLCAELLDELERRRLTRWTFILDDKDADQHNYDARYFRTIDDFEAAAAAGDVGEHRIAFCGDARADVYVDPERFAQLCKRLVQNNNLCAAVFDEIKRATTDGGRSWKAPTVRWVLTEGRSLGLWEIANAQHGKQCPDEQINEASTIAVFGQKARAANYIVDVLDLDPRAAAIVPSLAEGEFLLFVEERDWDGRIYKL